MTSNGIIMGIDGGGTSCRAALLSNGRHEARGGAANVSDFPRAIGVISSVIEDLLVRAAITTPDRAGIAVHLGLAGVMGGRLADAVRQALAERFGFGAIGVTDDQPTMVAGALGGRDGTVAAVGTGSFVARQQGADLGRIGGWGLAIGDQAAGAWLGRRLFQETMLAFDGLRPPTDLTRETLAGFHNRSEEIIAFAVAARPVDFAAFAPRIVDAAAGDDPLALDLMAEGAAYLTSAIGVLGWQPGETLCLAGGLGPRYGAFLPDNLARSLAEPLGSALDGALLLAERQVRQ